MTLLRDLAFLTLQVCKVLTFATGVYVTMYTLLLLG